MDMLTFGQPNIDICRQRTVFIFHRQKLLEFFFNISNLYDDAALSRNLGTRLANEEPHPKKNGIHVHSYAFINSTTPRSEQIKLNNLIEINNITTVTLQFRYIIQIGA
jgi:hypothetical protein